MEQTHTTVPNDVIDLRELFAVLKRRKKLIWIVTGILTILAIVYAFFVAQPIYQSSAIVELAQINKKPVDNINNIKQKLETVFKDKKIEFPLLKNIVIPKKTSNMLSLQTEGYDNASTKKKLQSVIEYLSSVQGKELNNFKLSQGKKLALISEDITNKTQIIAQTKQDIKNYQDKLLNISKQDAALAGIYSIELSRKTSELNDITNKIYSLKQQKNDLLLSISPQNLKRVKIIGQIKQSDHPVKPKKKLIVIVAFITGLMLSVFLAFFLEFIGGMKKEEEN